MTTIKNKFINLDIQVKAMIIAATILSSLFIVMININGFNQF